MKSWRTPIVKLADEAFEQALTEAWEGVPSA